jgi:hypothetical protein
MLHLSENDYKTTLCGLTVTDSMDVTDASLEVAADPETHDGCPKCCKSAARDIEAHEQGWRLERALEAGMLHGATAYNDEMGW